MKYLLAASAGLCCLSLWPLHRYRLTCLYLLACIPATLAFKAESQWLRAWYPWLAGPVVLFRLAAGVEVLHRQTEGFYFWCRLTGMAFVAGFVFAGMGWVPSPHPDFLQSIVEARRLPQLFLAGVFFYVQAFWLTQGGGWYRQRDHISALFGLMVWNHGIISFLSGALGWNEDTWNVVNPWSWGIDCGAYLLIALRCRLSPDASLFSTARLLYFLERFGPRRSLRI